MTAIKLLWLAIRDIEDERARARAKEKGLPANLGALALAYPDRINLYLT